MLQMRCKISYILLYANACAQVDTIVLLNS